ncbi:MAG: hypothetical protein AAFZ15_05325 [Bacteroidota bacterium]
MLRILLFCTSLWLINSCAAPTQESSSDQANNVLTDSILVTTDRFEFHSHSLVNLHHYLVQTTAFIRKKGITDKQQKLLTFLKDSSHVKNAILQKEDEAIFFAMTYYEDQLIDRNLLFDSLMNHYRYEIMSVKRLNELGEKDLPDSLKMSLFKMHPIFEKYLWDTQKNRNIKWVAERINLIDKIEENCLSKISQFYDSEFPWQKLRIEVCGNYTHWAGAYTSETPYPSVVISSYRKNYQNYHGTEMVFHETSHTLPGVYEKVQPIINNKCKQYKKGKHSRLWHAILFYTAGMVAKEAMEKEVEGLEYSMFMHEFDVSGAYHEVLEKYWLPYLKKEIKLEEALDQMVKNL